MTFKQRRLKLNYNTYRWPYCNLNISNLKKVNKAISEFVFKFAKEMRTSFRVRTTKTTLHINVTIPI